MTYDKPTYTVLLVVEKGFYIEERGVRVGAQLLLDQKQADEILQIAKKFDDGLKVYEIPVWQPKHTAEITYGVTPIDGDNSYGAMEHTLSLKGRSKAEEDKSLSFFHRVSRAFICRLDYGKYIKPHSNPDRTTIEGPHLHVYREGIGDAFALPLNEVFPDYDGDPIGLIKLFLDYCHISYEGIAFQGDLYA